MANSKRTVYMCLMLNAVLQPTKYNKPVPLCLDLAIATLVNGGFINQRANMTAGARRINMFTFSPITYYHLFISFYYEKEGQKPDHLDTPKKKPLQAGSDRIINPSPNKPWFLHVCSMYKSFENTVGKGEIARDEQFLLFPQCFLPIWRTFCHFYQIQNCRLQTVSVWKSLKLVVWERVESTPPGLVIDM